MRAFSAVLLTALALFAGCGDGDETSTPDTLVATGASTTEAVFTGEEAEAIGAVLTAIEQGDPLPYDEDGSTFQNREGLLPDEPLGYYREYTVETPNSPDRGARRLVIGEGGEIYYTYDHYASFERIDPEDYR